VTDNKQGQSITQQFVPGAAKALHIITDSASSAVCSASHTAEFERAMITERTKAGIAAARARGRNGGAPFKMTAAKLRLAKAAMGKPGTRIEPLCRELGITRQTLYHHVAPDGSLREHGAKLLGHRG